MAFRARLTPLQEQPTEWPYHSVKAGSLPASILFAGDRRMEAAGLLASGFRTRVTIESQPAGWAPLAESAEVWQPSRLAGIQVAPEFGAPFLTASQVFDVPPVPRKWLSLNQTSHAHQRFVQPGTILVTCSGTVGRTTLARNSLDGVLISHDLLRVKPRSIDDWGWLYAYLRAPSVIEMMQAAHYGHIVKHLEVSHLNTIPLVDIDKTTRLAFTEKAQAILDDRNRAEALIDQAHQRLSQAFHLPFADHPQPEHGTARCHEMASGRRRMEGAFYRTAVRSLLSNVSQFALQVDSLGNLTRRVWWLTRFSREFGDGGVHYRSADDLFSISLFQITEKRVFADPIEHFEDFFVKEGWILSTACSGQVYGLNGSVVLATKADERFFFKTMPMTDTNRSNTRCRTFRILVQSTSVIRNWGARC